MNVALATCARFAVSIGILLYSDGVLAQELSPKTVATNLSAAFGMAAERIRPSVVTISGISKKKPSRQGEVEIAANSLGLEDMPLEGMGTGVIIDSGGTILTNDHVLGTAEEFSVRVADRGVFRAKIVGRKPESDIAVIRINAADLPAAKLGNSEVLSVGDWVIAAGNPLGLENSITAGIVSAKGRKLFPGKGIGDLIQTDAAINPGNSGGPLVNLDGEVVGINTAIFSRTGGYMGIGFAIPINRAKQIAADLGRGSDGSPASGAAGSSTSVSARPAYEKLLGLKIVTTTEGTARIEALEPFGLAALSGLKSGDSLELIDGSAVTAESNLDTLLSGDSLRKGVVIRVERNKQKLDFSLRAQ